MNQNKFPILRSLWFWLFVMSAINFAFRTAGFPKPDVSSTLGYVAGFVGLFVPFGLFFFLQVFLFLPFAAVLALAVIWFGVFMQRKFDKMEMTLGKRIVLNLVVLFALTVFVDFFVTPTRYESLHSFMTGTKKAYHVF